MPWVDREGRNRTHLLRFKDLHIIVTRHVYYPETTWVLRCRGLDIDICELASQDLAIAKTEALAIVRDKLSGWLDMLSKEPSP